MSFNILRTSCSLDNTSAHTSNQKFLSLYAPIYYIMSNCSSCSLQDSNRVIYNNSPIENEKKYNYEEQKSEYIDKEIDRIRRDLHRKRMARQTSEGFERSNVVKNSSTGNFS
jgi:hypothetical protein